MTEAVQAPATAPAPEPVWVRYRIGSIRATKECKFIRLINDLEKTNEEYKDTEVDISEFQIGDIIECWIHGGRLRGARFPDGMEPIKEVTKHTGKPATPDKPPEPPVEITGDVSMLTEKGIKVGSHDMVYINGVDIGDIKVGTSVKAKISGRDLVEIEEFTPPIDPSKLRDGHGTIEAIDLTKPFLSYKFSWKDKQTNELKSAVQEFSRIIDDKVKQKASQFKVGDKITVKFSGGKNDAVLYDIEKDTGKGWGGRQYDPVAEAKRQRLIVRQSSLERSIQVWMNGNPGKEPTPEDDDRILSRMEKYAERVMKE